MISTHHNLILHLVSAIASRLHGAAVGRHRSVAVRTRTVAAIKVILHLSIKLLGRLRLGTVGLLAAEALLARLAGRRRSLGLRSRLRLSLRSVLGLP